MADKQIGALPGVQEVDGTSLFVAEQEGEAVKVTGAQVAAFAQSAVQAQISEAETAAEEAEAARQAIEDMDADVTTLDEDTSATVTKSVGPDGNVTLHFGIPRGQTGATGGAGPQGPAGTGLDIRGTYPSLPALQSGVPDPEQGWMYNVGTSAPYTIYMWDSGEGAWVSQGQLQGVDGATYTPSVSQDGTLSWTNNGNLPNPEAVNIRGPEGPAGADGQDGAPGADGAAGPNEISAATGTAYTGLLKGNGTSVVQAVSGTDYLAPIPGGVTGNLVTIGAGGALADSGKSPDDLGGGGSGGGWTVVAYNVNADTLTICVKDRTWPVTPPISLSGNKIIEFELEVYGLDEDDVINIVMRDSASDLDGVGFVAADNSENVSKLPYAKSRCLINTENRSYIAFFYNQTKYITMEGIYDAELVKIDRILNSNTIELTSFVVRYRIWDTSHATDIS